MRKEFQFNCKRTCEWEDVASVWEIERIKLVRTANERRFSWYGERILEVESLFWGVAKELREWIELNIIKDFLQCVPTSYGEEYGASRCEKWIRKWLACPYLVKSLSPDRSSEEGLSEYLSSRASSINEVDYKINSFKS